MSQNGLILIEKPFKGHIIFAQAGPFARRPAFPLVGGGVGAAAAKFGDNYFSGIPIKPSKISLISGT
jgi:hypothetical protein